MDITSLQDYISVLDKQFNGQYFYRGESMDFGDTKNMASGYRWMKDNDRRFLDLLNMRREYFREVGSHLNSHETTNFVAYAQHHGLPTELLDITANPLVALYFAVSENMGKDGFVHLFDNNRDYSQFIFDLYNPDLARLDNLPVERQAHWFFWTEDIDDDMVQKEMYEMTNSFVFRIYQKSNQVNLRTENTRQLGKLASSDHPLKDLYLADIHRRSEKRNQVLSGKEPVDHRTLLAFDIGDAFDLMGATNGDYFPLLKYLLVQPSIVFDRMKNQQGSFIYQLNTSHGSASKGYVQPIIPAETLVIPSEHKQTIFNQLDIVGINQKFIYSDDDNIAGYYKQHFNRSIDQELHPSNGPRRK